jgi:hypothetical protein
MSTDANPSSIPVMDSTPNGITDTKKIQDPNLEDTPRRGKVCLPTPIRGKVCSPTPNQAKATSCHTKTQDPTHETDVTKSPMSQDTQETKFSGH